MIGFCESNYGTRRALYDSGKKVGYVDADGRVTGLDGALLATNARFRHTDASSHVVGTSTQGGSFPWGLNAAENPYES